MRTARAPGTVPGDPGAPRTPAAAPAHEAFLPSTTETEGARRTLHGYTLSDSGQPQAEDVTEYNPSFAAGNGDMISTVGDLNRFDSALLAGRLLPKRLLRAMLTPTPGSFPGSDTFTYGLGVVIATTSCGVTVYGNAGSIQGYETWMGATRDGRHVMSLGLNNDRLDETGIITDAINAEFYGGP